MKVLIACEFSGIIRDAFIAKGHDAISCDLLPTESQGPHYQGNVFDIINSGFDLMIAHPPCTHLSTSGAQWFHKKKYRQKSAIKFFMKLMNADIPRIAIENPIGIMSSVYRAPDQIIQPWQFGDEAQKSTCLWLKRLPKLKSVGKIVGKGEFCITKSGRKIPAWYNLPPSTDRGKKRAVMFQGIADAMADQWGSVSDKKKGFIF